MSSSSSPRGRILGGSVAILVGLYVLGLLWAYPNWKGRQTLAWTEVPCEIVDSSTLREESSTFFAVTYRYEWEGAEHESSSFRAGVDVNVDRDTAGALLERYAVGTTHSCRVDPDDPAEAVLEPGAHAGPLRLGAGLFPIAIGAFFILRGLAQPDT